MNSLMTLRVGFRSIELGHPRVRLPGESERCWRNQIYARSGLSDKLAISAARVAEGRVLVAGHQDLWHCRERHKNRRPFAGPTRCGPDTDEAGPSPLNWPLVYVNAKNRLRPEPCRMGDHTSSASEELVDERPKHLRARTKMRTRMIVDVSAGDLAEKKRSESDTSFGLSQRPDVLSGRRQLNKLLLNLPPANGEGNGRHAGKIVHGKDAAHAVAPA